MSLPFRIIHSPTSDSPFLVVDKAAGLPSAPLFEGDYSVLTEALKLYPEINEVHGKKNVERGLVHRIDTETQGLVLIATSQLAYDNLILAQKEGHFEKWYRAEVENQKNCTDLLGGFPPLFINQKSDLDHRDFYVESFFRPFGQKGREVRPVTKDGGRAAIKKAGNVIYRTDIKLSEDNVAICHIKNGYRHQVRCHLAWCGFPVKNDKIYNPEAKDLQMSFSAFKITFPHPLTQIPQVFQM